MKKKVVFIMTDTTRKDMLGCYGNANMKTPNLDKLAEDGIKFENAYTCQPVCGPARSALFTGTYPHTNGMVANTIALGDNIKTLGQRLKDNNISCGYIGKWHLDGGDYFGMGRCADGWDEKYWYDMRRYLEELSDVDRVRSRTSKTSFDEDMNEEFTFAHRCSNRAIDFINEKKDDDFVLVVSYDEPHGPCLCPAPFNTMYDGIAMPDNPNYEDNLENKPYMQKLWAGKDIELTAKDVNRPSRSLSLYLGCNSFVDYEIGRVIDKINEVAPDALVFFTSDHGDMLGAHHLQGKNATAYNEIANIPFIVRGGEKGKTVTYPTSHIDVVPTILDYMGVPLPKILEGVSILPQIKDTSIKIRDNAFVEFTRYEVDHDGFGGMQIMRAIANENFKLVINLLDTDEFYDVKNDPSEMNNLINSSEYSHIRDTMHDELLKNMNETRDLYRGYQWVLRPWRSGKTAKWENDGLTRQREHLEYEPCQLDYNTGLEMESAIRLK